MVFSNELFVMLLTHERFKTFVIKPITDVSHTTTLLLSVSVNSLARVNKIAEKVIAAGGKEPIEAKDHGFMQQRTLEDLDGHIWEVLYMDLSKFPAEKK
jgi:uncharacterized protein